MTRKLLILVLTYFVVVIFFFVTKLPNPFMALVGDSRANTHFSPDQCYPIMIFGKGHLSEF